VKASEIRRSFLDHFTSRGHQVVRSSSLIPAGDPTLLFTNAGMNQFKDVFLGLDPRPYARAASAQKCLRVSGKHNDLEQVGRTARHHTFFEMLGNFSFGDYFKREAIAYAWEWVAGTLRLPPSRLWVSVFTEDDEAARLWTEVAGVDPARVVRFGEKDNFWAMGETGPCGPCSEIYYDQGPSVGCGRASCSVGCSCDRYLEFWNLVFMQFDRRADGTLRPLALPSVDTGAGLERIAAILQGVPTNYRTDLFLPLIEPIAAAAGTRYGAAPSTDVCLQVIADHLRAVCFLIADGVVPSNEKRGYVLRRVIRRALTFGRTLRLRPPFLHAFTGRVVDLMAEAYPELAERRRAVEEVCRREEEAFEATLARGVEVAEEVYGRFRGGEVPAEEAVRLYTTYGLSFEIQGALALPLGAGLPPAAALESEMEKHREQARASWKGAGPSEVPPGVVEAAAALRSEFLGYETLRVPDSRVLAVFRPSGRVAALQEGEAGFAVLDRTPFYAEAGGQVGDTGRLASADGGEAEVEDATSPAPGVILHHVRVRSGAVEEGGTVEACVNAAARAATMRNHTATHLLHAALKKVLGGHVQQAGSYVGPDRLRFDFNYPGPVPAEALREIEREVNEQILVNAPVDKAERSFDEAVRGGAVALFGEKYGDRVRVVTIPGYSQELCGGTHCRGTGDVGQMLVVSERGIAAGVRRIEALTGMAALLRARENEAVLRDLEGSLNRKREEVGAGVAALKDENRSLRREVERLRLRLAQGGGAGGERGAEAAWEEVEGVRILVRRVEGLERPALRTLADNLKREIGSGVVVLGSADSGKVALLVAVTDDLTPRLDARAIIKEIAEPVGGGGGGRPGLAEAGGRDPARLDAALGRSREALARSLLGAEHP
jgi:alanyl-tRNA synthetase